MDKKDTHWTFCKRNFDEKEIEMMAGSPGHPFWRCLSGLELALHYTTTFDAAGQQEVLSMFSTAIKGYVVKQCRMIMVPLSVLGTFSLYVYDRFKKRNNVLDPVFTLEDENAYRLKHEKTARMILQELKVIGDTLDDGWKMICSEWTIRYNMDMHLPCGPGESAAYVLHYAKFYDGGQLEKEIPLEEAVLRGDGNEGEHGDSPKIHGN